VTSTPSISKHNENAITNPVKVKEKKKLIIDIDSININKLTGNKCSFVCLQLMRVHKIFKYLLLPTHYVFFIYTRKHKQEITTRDFGLCMKTLNKEPLTTLSPGFRKIKEKTSFLLMRIILLFILFFSYHIKDSKI
jgi:hypothetical protein